MSPDKAFALEPGTMMEAGVVMPALCKERVVHQVQSVDLEKRLIIVHCFFFDVFLGVLHGREVNEKMEWARQLAEPDTGTVAS